MILFIGLTRFRNPNSTILYKLSVYHTLLLDQCVCACSVMQQYENTIYAYLQDMGINYFYHGNNEVNKTKDDTLKKYKNTIVNYRYNFNLFHIFIDIFTYMMFYLLANKILTKERINNSHCNQTYYIIVMMQVKLIIVQLFFGNQRIKKYLNAIIYYNANNHCSYVVFTVDFFFNFQLLIPCVIQLLLYGIRIIKVQLLTIHELAFIFAQNACMQRYIQPIGLLF